MFQNILSVWKIQYRWRDLVLVEWILCGRIYDVSKFYHHKLWLILLSYLACIFLLFKNQNFGELCSRVVFKLFHIFRVCCELYLVYVSDLSWVNFLTRREQTFWIKTRHHEIQNYMNKICKSCASHVKTNP